MSKSILAQALGVSMEEREEISELIAQHSEEEGTSPEVYVEERLEVEQDVAILDETAQELERVVEQDPEGESEVSLESAISLVNAITHRYGADTLSPSMESAANPAALAQQIRHITGALEGAADASLESFALSDMWDKLGMMDREIKEMRDFIAVLKNYDGSSKISMIGIYKLFMVDGSIPANLSKTVDDTAKVVEDMLRAGNEAIATAKKAADIAMSVNWSDHGKADDAIKKITSLKSPIKDISTRFKEQYVMANRRITTKDFDIKGALSSEWARGTSVKVSGMRLSAIDFVNAIPYVGGLAVIIAVGGTKRKVDLKELVAALEKFSAAAEKTRSVRDATPKKWTAHKLMVKNLKGHVKGSAAAQSTVRTISELDRTGWQLLNGAFSLIHMVIRQVNHVAGTAHRDAK